MVEAIIFSGFGKKPATSTKIAKFETLEEFESYKSKTDVGGDGEWVSVMMTGPGSYFDKLYQSMCKANDLSVGSRI